MIPRLVGNASSAICDAGPEAYIGGAAELFDASGAFVRQTTREFLQRFLHAFAAWVAVRARN